MIRQKIDFDKIDEELDVDDDWVFLPDNKFPETKQDPEAKTTSSDTELVFVTDYFNPSSENVEIEEPDIGSVEADDKKEVETQQVSFVIKPGDIDNESADSPNSKIAVPQIDEKIRVLEGIENGEEDDRKWEGNSGGISFWNRRLSGVGALFSFGFAAAATFCVIVLANQQRNRQQQEDQKVFFQHYSDE
ncbi:hypothetical protein V6N13_087789 [Hibiscus sabdariffa]|uniref:DUF6821 domain-containing protein n=1 Tax=Hibiscus sabdariffa TaxID=183260 RepID=A0ABR2FXB7_9ROSI